MSADVEMNDVKVPLMMGDEDKIPDVDFKGSKEDSSINKQESEFRGLTKEELEKFANDPFWKRLRLILFILFWVVWVGMLIAAILIVVFSPKCPKRPTLQFWEQKTGYWVDPFAFSDSDNNGVGDFRGIMSKLDYIQKQVGAGYIILDPIFQGQYSSSSQRAGQIESFRSFDNLLGKNDSLKDLIRESRKRGLEVILTVNYNALSKNSDFVKEKSDQVLIPWDAKFDNWYQRNGKQAKTDLNGKSYYSAVDSDEMIELNLQNELVITEIKESVRLILDLGFRGILLTDIGMYTEDPSGPSEKIDYNCSSNWYRNAHINQQLYSNSTLDFLRQIRQVMNEVAKKTDKSRLLMIDAGDVGIGLDREDRLLQYIEKDNVVDMVISREFLKTRGWKVSCGDTESSIRKYLNMIPVDKRKKVALTSATSTSARATDLLKIATPFLVEGHSIVYYGSELGIECQENLFINGAKLYPETKKFSVENETSVKCNHNVMPWDNSGEGFYNGNGNDSNKYFSKLKPTVQGLTAIGMGETILQLHQKLIKIRKEPSLLWGKMNEIEIIQSPTHSYEIFSREADGFPKIVVALSRDLVNKGKVFSTKSFCNKFIPILVYPSNSNLKENTEIESKSIYLHTEASGSIHVFKCV